MNKLIVKYKNMKYEERLIFNTMITMSVSAVIALGKITIGLFSDLLMCAVGVFNILLLIAKLGCVLAVKKNKPFKRRNAKNAIFLFCAGLLYTVYMAVTPFFGASHREYTTFTSIITAAIAFAEMGIAVYGLIRTKSKGHYYRNIKIIGFTSALVAIMTAQVALLSVFDSNDTTVINSYTGAAIGIITMLLAVYVYFAPQISTIDREHNVFKLNNPDKNNIIDMDLQQATLTLCKSNIYGSYVYGADINDGIIDGHIKKNKGFWKGLPLPIKILFIILSEILIFVWLLGYIIYFVRSIDMPSKLKRLMERNGFTLLQAQNNSAFSETNETSGKIQSP